MRMPLTLVNCVIGLFIASAASAAECLTTKQAREVVPYVDNVAFDEIQDLAGPAYLEFVKIVADKPSERPPADEAMIFYRIQKGHGADVRVVWFAKGCAISKASYPAEFWIYFAMYAKGV